MQRRLVQTIRAKVTGRRIAERWFVWLAVAGAVLLVGVIVVYSLANRSIISPAIVSEADFSVYAPRHAPEGYEFRSEQTNLTGRMLTYSFQGNKGGEPITVTVQPRPDGFDITQMTKGGAVNSLSTTNGTLYDLSIGGASQYLLDTGDALVYLTSASQISTATINDLANSLHKLN